MLNIVPNNNVYAKDALDTIVDTLTGLTCETQGVGDLLRTEFSHTCIPAPFFTFAVANIISPGLYANNMLRLKINDRELFADKFPDGQCARMNKVDYNDPVLEFALCNNVDLVVVRAGAVAASALAIVKAVLTGKDPWDDIADAWKSERKKYHRFFKGKDGDKITMPDLGVIPIIHVKVVKIKDTLCVASPTVTLDWAPIGCKYMTEPFPDSIYKSFSSSGGVEHGANQATDPMAIVDCGVGKSSCYQRAYENSKTAIVISAPIIECIKEMTARLLVSNEVCTFDDVKLVINSSKRESSILFQFQRNMHRTVTALLTIYVMFFGAKIILSGDVPPKNEIINFILKMIFVIYFSVGININPTGGNAYGRLDGMVQWAFPLLLGGVDTLAGWIINASPSELCKFNSPDVVYNPKLSYMALWDALDCRVAHYLGLDMISTLLVENSSKKFDFFSFSAPPYVYLLIPAIISGNMTLVSLALSYPLLVISVGAFLVNATVMCIVSIVILGVLAPLFVPMLLFEYTRGYFESWVKLLISFLLQPMVVTTFMIMMFSVYDFGFYGHCKYTGKIIESSIESSVLTGSTAKRKVKIFYIDNDWNKYSPEDEKSCKNSLGYMLNNPLSTLFDFAKDSLEEMVKEKPGGTSTDKFLSKFQFLQGIVLGPGMFFVSPKILFEKIRDIVLALITACFTLYLIYHFSAQLAEFAADMTEGVALNNVTIKPQAIFKAGMAAIGAAGGAMDMKAGGGGQTAGDSSAIGGGDEADDLLETEEGGEDEAGDSVSTGEGGSARQPIRTEAAVPPSSSTLETAEIESVDNISAELPIQGQTTSGSDTVSSSDTMQKNLQSSTAETETRPGLEKADVLDKTATGGTETLRDKEAGEKKLRYTQNPIVMKFLKNSNLEKLEYFKNSLKTDKNIYGRSYEENEVVADYIAKVSPEQFQLDKKIIESMSEEKYNERIDQFKELMNKGYKGNYNDYLFDVHESQKQTNKQNSSEPELAQEKSMKSASSKEMRGSIARIVPGSLGMGGSTRSMHGNEQVESISKELDGKSLEDKKKHINKMLSEDNLPKDQQAEVLTQLLAVETGKRGGELNEAYENAKEEGREITEVERKSFDDGLKLQTFLAEKIDELKLDNKNPQSSTSTDANIDKSGNNNFGLIHRKPYPLPKSPQQEWEEKKKNSQPKQQTKDGSDENA